MTSRAGVGYRSTSGGVKVGRWKWEEKVGVMVGRGGAHGHRINNCRCFNDTPGLTGQIN